MRMKLAVMIVGVGLAAAPAFGHHSFAAEFDAKKPVKLQGTVTKMEWINPHAWIYVDVKNTDGSVTNWMVEAGAPNASFDSDAIAVRAASNASWYEPIQNLSANSRTIANLTRITQTVSHA